MRSSIAKYAALGCMSRVKMPEMDGLISRGWKTKTSVVAKDGKIAFRGFRGRYRLTWKDASGKEQSKLVDVAD